jgi:WhiB family transcriptional regulator, redox-sensing transcriptional regulator
VIRVDRHLSRLRSSAGAGTPLEAALEPLLAWMRERPWIADALCAQTDPELFFPEKGGSTADAKRVCAACPVRAQCEADAVRNNEGYGVWGGSVREDRRLERRELSEVAA